ncbi:MAG: hypothetical protein IJA72_00530 [Clostridia bacterium]|nr:hypothetical protein [Clostridia bacterium]
MNYIKDLYTQKPQIVKKLLNKLFVEKKIVEVSHEEEEFDENDIMFNFINKFTGDETKIILEDFAICYGLEYLEISDRRLREYLKFMAKLYGNEYLQGFHTYRAEERKELIAEFNSATYAMEGELAKAINSMNKKEENKTL